MRLPNLPGDPRDVPDALKYEVVQEMAFSLGHAGRRAEEALARLHSAEAGERSARVVEAAEVLWYYVVQREACGLRDNDEVLERMQVPHEVMLRMGPRRTAR